MECVMLANKDSKKVTLSVCIKKSKYPDSYLQQIAVLGVL